MEKYWGGEEGEEKGKKILRIFQSPGDLGSYPCIIVSRLDLKMSLAVIRELIT